MVPVAVGAHLDDVGRQRVVALVELRELGLLGDAAPVGRESRPEHVGDQHEGRSLAGPLGADGAFDAGWRTDLTGRANELGMGVAHLMASEPALAILGQQRPAGQPIVDDARTARVRSSQRFGPKRHLDQGTAPTPVSPAARVVPTKIDGVEPTDDELRLCGDVSSKRVLDLGCGRGDSTLAFARRRAKVIGIDHSADQLAYARRLAEEEDLRVELRHEDLADLAFLPPASVDVAFSGSALTHVIDTGRVFRQVHRVLKTGAPFVFSVEHPAARLGAGAAYWSGYTISDLYGGLQRANFEIDTLLEPEVGRPGTTLVPTTLVMRGRKLGL